MDEEAPSSRILRTEEYSSPSSEAEQLHMAMQIADAIRRYEKEQEVESFNSSRSASSASDSSSDPLTPFRKLIALPGVIPGCIAAGFGILAMIPARRTLLRVCDKYWNLGTAFPDLIVTPMLTVYVAQCSLWIGSLYGSSFYLNKLASFPVEEPSNTADAMCNDPSIIQATLRLPSIQKIPPSNSMFRQWDPRHKLLSNLQDVVRSCKQRRDFFNNNSEKQSDKYVSK